LGNITARMVDGNADMYLANVLSQCYAFDELNHLSHTNNQRLDLTSARQPTRPYLCETRQFYLNLTISFFSSWQAQLK